MNQCYCGSDISVVRGVCLDCQIKEWRHRSELEDARYSLREIHVEMIRWGREQREEYQQQRVEQMELWKVE